MLVTALLLLVSTSATEVRNITPLVSGQRVPSVVSEALVQVMEASSDSRCTRLLFIHNGFSLSSIAVETVMGVNPVRASGVFLMEEEREGNGTQLDWMSVAISQARQVRMVSWCVMVVVVSNSPNVLSTFAELSLKNHLLVPSTRLIAITQLPLRRLENMEFFHKVFSRMDAMIFLLGDSKKITSGGVYIYLPNIAAARGRIQLATLSPKGLISTSHLPFFPDKYTKFLKKPVLKIVEERQSAIGKKDAGCNQKLFRYLEQGMNFTCTMVYANLYGTKQADGTWSGMIGMIIKEEADISMVSFAYTSSRGQVVDYTTPLLVQYSVILGKLGQPELDPWSFHLPLEPYVWLSIVITLLLVSVVMLLLSLTSQPFLSKSSPCWASDVFQLLRVLLQQDILTTHDIWQRRVVLATWMIVAFVLVRSYASNLMSVLAVRYIQQPYQSLRNVLDDPGVTMIWQTNSSRVQYFRSVKSGIFREVAEREKAGGIKFQLLHEFWGSMDTFLRKGDHVLIAVEIMTRFLISHDFTKRGQCDFYTAKERLLPVFLSGVGQKGNPVVPQLNKRIISMQESGLYDLWIEKNIPNSTSCTQTPSRITKNSSFSLPHLWGVMVVLASSHGAGLLLLVWEVKYPPPTPS